MLGLLQRLLSFLVMSFAFIVVIYGLFLLLYIILWGIIILLALFAIAWVKNTLSPTAIKPTDFSKGRTIDHE